MEDSPTVDARAEYARVTAYAGDYVRAGLFTRPAVLALRDEAANRIPVRMMNRACRLLLDIGRRGGSPAEAASAISSLAEAGGLGDGNEFHVIFRQATGWLPGEWFRRFCRRDRPGS